MALKIIQWNIRGYVNNYSELQIIIKTQLPHIIALQETHLKNLTNIPIPINYSIFANNYSPRFGGTAILIHNSIQSQEISLPHDFDATGVEIKSIKTFNVISAYIPPHQKFNETNLHNVIQFNSNTNSLVLGDFNSWSTLWGSPKNSQKGRTITNFLNNNSYILLNDKSPTHFSTHNTYTHIDISFCTPGLFTHTHWHILDDLHGSDHYPITLTLFDNDRHNTTQCKPSFKLNSADWPKFEHQTHVINSQVPSSNNINKEASNLNKIILQSAHLTIPQTSTNKHPKNVPWWNHTLQTLNKEKKQAANKLKKYISTTNITNFRKAAAKFRRELKIAKKESFYTFTSEIQPLTHTSKIWSNIRRFCGLNKPKHIHMITNPITDIPITDNLEIANSFTKFWSDQSKDSNFSDSFKKNKYANTFPYIACPCRAAQQIESDITSIELKSSLSTLKGHTPGLDRISYPMIANSSPTVKSRLLNHYNNIFNNFIPQSYKLSLIIPILKPNSNKTIITSYRPISLNSCFAKVLDKIMAKRLWWFVRTNKLIHTNQVGFKQGKSVVDNLAYLDHLITDSLTHKQHISIISLDFAKAFDKIGIHAIVTQLQEWNIGPKILNYIINFMKNRKIKCRIYNNISETLALHNGIPQGSPISVILFLIAYNKLSNLITVKRNLSFVAYADDFHIIVRFNKNQTQETKNLDDIFDNISEWCAHSGSSLSLTKCKHLHICRKHSCNSTISTNFPIPRVEHMSLLGLTIDSKYRWKKHIDTLASSLTKKLNIVKCLSNPKFNCSTHTLILVTKALIVAKIDYGLMFYGNCPRTHLKPIQSLLNSAIRTALGAFRSTPINNLLIEANINTVLERRDFLQANLIRNLTFSTNSPLTKIAKSITKKSSLNIKVPSAIINSSKLCKQQNINLRPLPEINSKLPPWNIPNDIINTDLTQLDPHNTNQSITLQCFLNLKNKFKNHTFLYTDGSKTQNTTSYAITTENDPLKIGLLPHYTSVYSAEIIAIREAILLAKTKTGKFVICSDSLSSIQAINNIDNHKYYASAIRSQLIQVYPKIRLLWVPGHKGIRGNELADQQAKEAPRFALTYTQNANLTDINRTLKTNLSSMQTARIRQTSDWYQSLNHNTCTPGQFIKFIDHNNISRQNQIKIIRLRLGHTKISHEHLFDPAKVTYCSHCQNSTKMTVQHILVDCSSPLLVNLRAKFFSSPNPQHLLNNPSNTNLTYLTNFLKEAKLYNLV